MYAYYHPEHRELVAGICVCPGQIHVNGVSWVDGSNVHKAIQISRTKLPNSQYASPICHMLSVPGHSLQEIPHQNATSHGLVIQDALQGARSCGATLPPIEKRSRNFFSPLFCTPAKTPRKPTKEPHCTPYITQNHINALADADRKNKKSGSACWHSVRRDLRPASDH